MIRSANKCAFHLHSQPVGAKLKPPRRPGSVRRIRVTLNRLAFFQERLSEVRNGCGQQFRLFILWSEENKVDEAFGHVHRQRNNIDLLLPLNVLLNQVIDFAVQATLRVPSGTWLELEAELSPTNLLYHIMRRDQIADRWVLWRGFANHRLCACWSGRKQAAPRTTWRPCPPTAAQSAF